MLHLFQVWLLFGIKNVEMLLLLYELIVLMLLLHSVLRMPIIEQRRAQTLGAPIVRLGALPDEMTTYKITLRLRQHIHLL